MQGITEAIRARDPEKVKEEEEEKIAAKEEEKERLTITENKTVIEKRMRLLILGQYICAGVWCTLQRAYTLYITYLTSYIACDIYYTLWLKDILHTSHIYYLLNLIYTILYTMYIYIQVIAVQVKLVYYCDGPKTDLAPICQVSILYGV